MTNLNLFHNTIHLESQELEQTENSCKKQEEKIVSLFKRFPGRYTPFDIQRLYQVHFRADVPVTSIRRGLSNLTDQNILRMLDKSHMKKEKYGKPNHKWELV